MATDTKKLLNAKQIEEAEAFIRAQPRICRGPLREQERKAVAQLLDEGRLEEAKAMDETGRNHPETGANTCGADFNNIVVAGPWDGRQHPYKCPRCGVVGKYTAPTFAAPQPTNEGDPV